MSGTKSYRKGELGKITGSGGQIKVKFVNDEDDTKWLDITSDEYAAIESILTAEPETDQNQPAYYWLGWDSEEDEGVTDAREGVYFITICHPDGEEYASIIHRTFGGQFPLDGDVAKGKEADAQRIVDALNRQ